jgi:hypothetical protein
MGNQVKYDLNLGNSQKLKYHQWATTRIAPTISIILVGAILYGCPGSYYYLGVASLKLNGTFFIRILLLL